MRLDKYLKVSRIIKRRTIEILIQNQQIIKRRTVANEACDAGRVTINGKVAKPSSDVNEGDVLEIRMGARLMRVRVVSVLEHAAKADASDMYEQL